MKVPNPNATEKITLEDAEFEISVTLPISFKNQYADKLMKIDDNSFSKLYEIYREIVKKGLKSTTVEDENGNALKWDGQCPDSILDKLSTIQLDGSKHSSLLGALGQKIWELNNRGFFRAKPDKAGDADGKA